MDAIDKTFWKKYPFVDSNGNKYWISINYITTFVVLGEYCQHKKIDYTKEVQNYPFILWANYDFTK
jgi:hypothetical protein